MRRALAASCVFVVVIVLTGRSVSAQEKGQIGLTMSYPTSVGVIWHATDRIAIRPEITIGSFWSESGLSASLSGPGFVSSSTTTSDSWTIDTDVSALFYLKRWDNVHSYVTPGFGYQWTTTTYTTTIERSSSPTITETMDLSTRGYEIRGAFGVHYAPHRKFSVFGEAGIEYSKLGQGRIATGDRSFSRPESETLGNTATVGIIFYFR